MTYYAFMGSEDTKGGVPFRKGKRKSPGGVQILWRGQGEVSVIPPPRPLQTTPTPSSGTLIRRPVLGFAGPGFRVAK